MKKMIVAFAMIFALSFVAFADDYAIPFAQLPQVSQTFVQTHFKDVNVALSMRDSHSFEVRFEDGTEVEFDHVGKWKEVDCKYKALPASVLELVPAGIPTYVTTNFPQSIITKVNVKAWGYEVELNNGLDLEFNKAGAFLRIDD